MPSTLCRLPLVGFGLTAILVSIAPLWAAEPAVSIEKITHSLTERSDGPAEYWATRRYLLENKRFHQKAEMVVRVHHRDGEGKQFEILQRTGSPMLQRRVLDKVIEAERELSVPDREAEILITPRNYEFRLAGKEVLDGRLCHVLEIKPRRKGKYWLQGRVWLDAADHSLVRLEGRPTAGFSMWIGRPEIVQQFRLIDGHWLVARSDSQSDSGLFGTSVLTVEHYDYRLMGTALARNTPRAVTE